MAFSFAHATTPVYFDHTRNEDLKSQLADQPWRVFPKPDQYSFAADTYLYKPSNTGYYYHGTGYWVNLLGEARPHPDITLNLKLAAYNGASSYGYGHTDFIQPFFGLTWTPKFLPENWKLYFRYFDLDRQMLGAGLLLEDKEMNGLIGSLSYSDWRYKGVIDGTGGYYNSGDLIYQQFDWLNNRLGVSATFISYTGHDVLESDNGDARKAPQKVGYVTTSLFSIIPWNQNWITRAEVGLRNGTFGELAAIKWQTSPGKSWGVSIEPEARYYGQRFGDQLSHYVRHDYVSPEIEDESFVEGRNILAAGDSVTVLATRVDAEWRVTPRTLLASSNEVYSMDYVHKRISGYYYKQGAGLCPYLDRPHDCLMFIVGNKIVNAHDPFGADGPAYSFARHTYIGANAFLYF
jgi:hypothetical protein